jgi:hypothetical protein
VQLRRIVTLVLLAFVAACGGGGGGNVPAGPVGAAAPSASVERFLRLVQAKNYREMGLVFGTREGSIYRVDPVPTVEKRMFAIASILDHQGFTLMSEEPIPGRIGEAVRMTVQLASGNRRRQVPFVVVRHGSGWLVEQVDLERITRPSR